MDNPYKPIQGNIPLMGRRDDWERIMEFLETYSVSIVGPRSIGKTVLLKAFDDHFATHKEKFDACIFWKVRDGRPQNDTEFYSIFAKRAATQIETINKEIGEFLAADDADFEAIGMSFKELDRTGKKVLLIMDGLDNLLSESNLSKNIWDNLRALADNYNLKYLIGSRKHIQDIVGWDEVRTSLFWDLFERSTRPLGAFKQEDLDEILSFFEKRRITISREVRAEIFYFTGGVPILTRMLCEKFWETAEDESCLSEEVVRELQDNFIDEKHRVLDPLWSDCEEDERGVIFDFAAGKEFTEDEIRGDCRNRLYQRGFVQKDGTRLKVNGAIKDYVIGYQARIDEVRRLFGNLEDYNQNIKEALSLRLEQIQNTDPTMLRHTIDMIQKFNHPSNLLNEVRGLVNRAFQIIWQAVLLDGNIPTHWTTEWKSRQAAGNRDYQGRLPEGKINDSIRFKLLDWMTGKNKVDASKVSRKIYIHLNNLHEVGNLGQHLDEEITHSFVVAICFSAIDLCDQLGQDIRS